MTEPFAACGDVVAETEAPEPLRFVRALAERHQELLPETIIIGLAHGSFVTESQLRREQISMWQAKRHREWLCRPRLRFIRKSGDTDISWSTSLFALVMMRSR